uniref:Uncharacterized protein n=1 Tax=Cacopsylla melanoneura TaxID=428564 RepID=A0A8D8U8C2_9HEMI
MINDRLLLAPWVTSYVNWASVFCPRSFPFWSGGWTPPSRRSGRVCASDCRKSCRRRVGIWCSRSSTPWCPLCARHSAIPCPKSGRPPPKHSTPCTPRWGCAHWTTFYPTC